MKRLVFLLLVSVLAISVAWLVGCGKKSAESAPKIVGDTNSAEFQSVSEVFYSADEIDGMIIEGTLELAGDFIVTATPRENRRATASDPVFHESSMHWYCVNTASETTFVAGHPDSVQNISQWVRIDSLQFLHLDTPKMIPNPALLTEIRAGVQLTGHAQLTNDSVRATRFIQIVGVPGNIAGRGDVTVNAGGATVAGLTFNKVRNDTVTSCQFGLDMSSVWTNLTANLAAVTDSNKCPTSGTISWSGSINMECTRANDSISFGGAWSSSQTFNGDQVTYAFENATTRWTVTETCGDTLMASPLKRVSNPLD